MNEQVEKIVSSHFGIEQSLLRSKDVTRSVTDARHFLWYILCDIMGYSARYVAACYGVTKRNVLYSVTQIRDGVKMQPYYANQYREILKELKEINLL